ncbi:MAG: protein phosphatase CheZ [Comamonas sp.]
MVVEEAKAPAAPADAGDVHTRIGQLTRQLHTALTELGYASQLRSTMGELPDAQSRLSYISRLTGEAAEKVLGRVEMSKAIRDRVADEGAHVLKSLVADPVAAVAKGEIYNFLVDLGKAGDELDSHLTEIMMAQDFHDLTGQVIARVVTLAATIEEQLVHLVIQTAPPGSVVAPEAPPGQAAKLQGPVVNPEKSAGEVVTDQSQVDDLLASLGF